mmetsp:Transcript_6265/g.13539  ORF Transcript_6265/g.13539 Transcript_6265/m.13539 type:complete len:301 (+) Transcript_6265:33-935(+)
MAEERDEPAPPAKLPQLNTWGFALFYFGSAYWTAWNFTMAVFFGAAGCPVKMYKRTCDLLDVKFRKRSDCPDLDLANVTPRFFLCNHRGWGDFTIDGRLTGGASYLSRSLVLVALPVQCGLMWILHGIIFFKRTRPVNLEHLGNLLCDSMANSETGKCIIYPEGTRNTEPKGKPLKRGTLSIAYSRKIPCQVLISTNKEFVVNEAQMKARSGVTVTFATSGVIDPSKYETEAKFFEVIDQEWAKTWTLAYDVSAPNKEYHPDIIPVRGPSTERLNVFRAAAAAAVAVVAAGVVCFSKWQS